MLVLVRLTAASSPIQTTTMQATKKIGGDEQAGNEW